MSPLLKDRKLSLSNHLNMKHLLEFVIVVDSNDQNNNTPSNHSDSPANVSLLSDAKDTAVTPSRRNLERIRKSIKGKFGNVSFSDAVDRSIFQSSCNEENIMVS